MAELAVRIETTARTYNEDTGETHAVFDTVAAGVVIDSVDICDYEGRPAIFANGAVCVEVPDGSPACISRPLRGIFANNPVDESDIEGAIERLLTGEDRKVIVTLLGGRVVGRALGLLDRIINEGNPQRAARAEAVQGNIGLVLAELGTEAAQTTGKLFVLPAAQTGSEVSREPVF